jgi:hypothetical protein
MNSILKLRFWRGPKIFITYRRNDTDGHAGRLYADLIEPFPKKNVFFDIDTLKAGDEFPEEIEKTVNACDALLVVIGRNWLTIKEGDARRIDSPTDYVRREIAAALKLKRKIVVIPILVQGATMPDEEDLPDELKPLARRNAMVVSDHRWDYDVKQLYNRLKRVVPLGEPMPDKMISWQKIGLALISFVALALGIWGITRLPFSTPSLSNDNTGDNSNSTTVTNSNSTSPRSQTTNTASTEQPTQNPSLGELKVYFGNLHAHTTYSDGSGTPNEAYQYAKNQGALDFLAITDHNHSRADINTESSPGNEQPERVPDGLMIGTDSSLYTKTIQDAIKNTKDDEFIAFYGQEFSTISSGNHLNVYSADSVISDKEVPNGRFDILYGSWLPRHEEVPFIQFNHPWSGRSSSLANYQYGLDDYDNSYEKLRAAIANYPTLIEVIGGPAFSVETGQAKLHSEDAYRLYLTRGFHLAPTAGQDNHFRTWGTATDARTAVLAKRLTGPDMVEAVKSLRCYATTDKNLKVWFTVNGAIMGREIEVRGLEVEIQYIVDDGDEPYANYEATIVSGSPETPDSAIETTLRTQKGKHQARERFNLTSNTAFIYLKIKQTSGDASEDVVLTSPVWVKIKT